MEKTKVVVTRGIPASGKSTWAKEQVENGNGKWKRINKDDLRAIVDCGKYSKENEKIIENIRDSIIKECLSKNINVIVDDTNLSDKHINRVQNIVDWHNDEKENDWTGYGCNGTIKSAEVEIKWFPITLDEALYRNNNREARVPDKVLVDMMRQYIKAGGPNPAPKIPDQLGLSYAIICDLDGTLADFSKNRGPFEQEKCANDECVEPVAQLLSGMELRGYMIILVSGRYDTYRPQTIEFLNKNCIEYDHLFMRKAGDNRSDTIVKEEIYNEHIKGKYNVLFAVDDRPCVIRMWKRLGLFVFNVGSGLEF